MIYNEIYKIVTETILANFRVLPEQLKPEAYLKDDLGLDSFDLVDLICNLETKLNKNIPKPNPNMYEERWIAVTQGTLQDVCNFLLKVANNVTLP